MAGHADEKQRLDKWLFFSRLIKSRSLAQKFVLDGAVTLHGATCRTPSQTVKPGDRLTLKLDNVIRIVEVLKPGDRRGPAPEAQTLYLDHTPPATPRGTEPDGLVPEHGGRPEKAERRAYERLRARIFEGN